MPAPAAMLAQLKGMGPEFTAILWSEGLFRSFSNRRQLAAYAGLGADTLAERVGRSRTGGLQGRQSAAANDDDTARVAVAATTANLGAERLVSRARPEQRR